MGFIEDLAALTATIRQRVAVVKTEEATKMSLIVPMLQTWGYDPFNPLEVTPEYTADVGTKQKEKVDYAIMRDGEPIILVECKPAGMPLEKHGSQLFRYFSVCPAKIGILTNGVEYRFFSDTEHENQMDLVPFLTVNLLDLKPGQDAQVSEDGIETTEDEMNGLRIVQAIASELVDPSRLVPRDNKSYYNILLDDTIRQQVCRLYLNTSNWYIGTYEEKQENRQPLEKLTDIYKHREQILAAIRRYEGDGQ